VLPERIPIFERADPSSGQGKLAVNRHASWWTWSSDARQVFRSWNNSGIRLPAPVLTQLPGDRAYPYTYSIRFSQLRSRVLREELLLLASSLRLAGPGGRLMLFTGLLDDYLEGDRLQFLFAGLRAAMVRMTGDRLAALHVPLDSADRKDFPLHADLYPPPILFNVFDGVDVGNRGASIFLKTSVLKGRLSRIAEMPAAVGRKIARLLTDEVTGDHFNEFFDLLHGPDHAWTPVLERLMRQQQLLIKMRRGQGYMIDDRQWLHGRAAVSGTVGKRRLQRLLFRPETR
jgi:hypothetical protein